MGNSMVSAIEDLIDELEDSVYNHEDNYKIKRCRNKITFALNNLLTEEIKEVKKLYRFKFHSEITVDCLYSGFYLSDTEAYDHLDSFKEKISENHAEWNRYAIGDTIEIQEINLDEVEDIDYYAESKTVSEIIIDEGASEEKRIELAECCGIVTSPEDYQVVRWKDNED